MWRGLAAVPLYLMAGYAYEALDYPIIEDKDFDMLCRHLQEHWEDLRHPHRDWIDPEALPSATCGYLNDEFYVPPRVLGALERLIRDDDTIELEPHLTV
jgi:hypothetical protein